MSSFSERPQHKQKWVNKKNSPNHTSRLHPLSISATPTQIHTHFPTPAAFKNKTQQSNALQFCREGLFGVLALKVLFEGLWVWHLRSADWTSMNQGLLSGGFLVRSTALLHLGLLSRCFLLGLDLLLSSGHYWSDSCKCTGGVNNKTRTSANQRIMVSSH